MAQNVISQRFMTLKGQGHRSKQMAPSDSLTSKNIYLDAKIIILCALLSKLLVKDVILHNGGQRNAFAYVSRSNPLKIFFDLLKVPDPSYPVLKFGDDLSSRNRGMAQNVILHICDLERSRSNTRSIKFCTAMRTLPMSIHAKFRWNLMASCLDTVNKSWPGKEEEEERELCPHSVDTGTKITN